MSELRLEIVADTDAESPRNWDNLGIMVCHHRRYNLGDDNGFDNAREIVRSHYSETYLDEYDLSSPSDVLKLLENSGKAIILPLYLYDHSGITMKTTPFSCPWDSGQVGFIFVTKERIRSEYGWSRITEARQTKIESYLTGEVGVYDQFLTGDVWGFRTFEDDEEVDSCWGFFGSDPKTNGISEHLTEPFQALLNAFQFERRFSLD